MQYNNNNNNDGDMELEEDQDFMRDAGPSGLEDDDLEEDETFLQPQSETAATQEQPIVEDALPMETVEDLEEDPSFLLDQPEEAQPPQQSTSASTFTSPSKEHTDAFPSTSQRVDDDEELPKVASIFGNVTHQRLDVGNLDLGQRLRPTQSLTATGYDGRKVFFGRKKGNLMIGEVSLSEHHYIDRNYSSILR